MHQPVDGGNGGKGAEHSEQRIAVVVIGVSVAEIHVSSMPFGKNDASGVQLLVKGERSMGGAGGW